jgi:hypothetical protein
MVLASKRGAIEQIFDFCGVGYDHPASTTSIWGPEMEEEDKELRAIGSTNSFDVTTF